MLVVSLRRVLPWFGKTVVGCCGFWRRAKHVAWEDCRRFGRPILHDVLPPDGSADAAWFFWKAPYSSPSLAKAAEEGRIIKAPWEMGTLVQVSESAWEQEVADLGSAASTSYNIVERLAARQKGVKRCSAK